MTGHHQDKPWPTIHSAHCHCGWDNALQPVVTVAPGETITPAMSRCRRRPLHGKKHGGRYRDHGPGPGQSGNRPRIRRDAEPGDALKVTIRDFAPSGFGWSAIIPGFGLLADQFTEPHLHLWDYDIAAKAPAAFNAKARVPLKPFAGTIGVALAEPGSHDIIPPRRTGGNMDIRDMAAGTELWLPVEAAGALFSVGDTHAAQGVTAKFAARLSKRDGHHRHARPRERRRAAISTLLDARPGVAPSR